MQIIIQFCFQFLETPLYLVPKAQPNSEDPSLEWRLSFSLVEKKIFESVPYIFRKVYLLCKNLTIKWKNNYEFPSYVLKTAFLWTYEDWQKSENEFTEDNTLKMMLQLFTKLYKYYKEGVIPIYFIPEQNLLDHNLEKPKEAFITELEAFADLQSLSSCICEYGLEPFCQIYELHLDPESYRVQEECVFPMLPSYDRLQSLYKERIQTNKGIRDNEDKLELLLELYVTFLFMLKEIIFKTVEFKNKSFINILYHLIVFGHSYKPKEIMEIDFVNGYNEYIDHFLNVCFPNVIRRPINYFILPYACYLDEEIKLNTQNIIRESCETEKLPQKWIHGEFDNHDISVVHEMYRFGNRKHSENVHKQMMVNKCSLFDQVFKALVSDLNSDSSQRVKQKCLKEMEIETASPNPSYKSYF